jgi:hypothetical protein
LIKEGKWNRIIEIKETKRKELERKSVRLKGKRLWKDKKFVKIREE